MKEEQLKKHLDKGYGFTDFCDKSLTSDAQKVRLVDLTTADLNKLVTGSSQPFVELLTPTNKKEIVLARIKTQYHIAPDDVLARIKYELSKPNGVDYKDIREWAYTVGAFVNHQSITLPIIDDAKMDNESVKDYLFDDPDHIVRYTISLIRNNLDKINPETDLVDIRQFIIEITEQYHFKKITRSYSDRTLGLILLEMSIYASNESIIIPADFREFYSKNLLKAADNGDYHSIYTLGYEYYKGTNGFPVDLTKSLYWLLKAYKMKQDPSVARTLGYIYYHGKANNGEPDGEKAFQYFAIAHFAGDSYEATYKLADCYIKGYGTPINHQAAYKLVSGIYYETKDYFLHNNDTKFADIALRMGNYYKDGIFVQKDLKEAYKHYLEAKTAIKLRLQHAEYIGDKGVAQTINTKLLEMEKLLDVKTRVVKQGGFLLSDTQVNYLMCDIKVSHLENGYVKIVISRPNKNLLTTLEEIAYCERSASAEYQLITKLSKEDYKQYNKPWDSFVVDGNIVKLVNTKNNEVLTIKNPKLVYIPHELPSVEKMFTVVGVQFMENGRIFDYIHKNKDVKIDDTLIVYSRGEKKKVTVKEVKHLYEDQLPLPVEKMGNAY